MQITRMFQSQSVSGSPVQVGDITVTPQSRAMIVRLPFGGLVWRRPTAVLVERAGQTSRIPIVDVTRVIQLALLGASVLTFSATVWILVSRARSRWIDKSSGKGVDLARCAHAEQLGMNSKLQ